ncbi:hypothetical protein Q6300_28220, partial [Klebsiella pneumoniae]|uniref:hypothetical protein n=1 Tax=Klebsiella pneumoniae TaxID=573 RepID=UPI00272EF14C
RTQQIANCVPDAKKGALSSGIAKNPGRWGIDNPSRRRRQRPALPRFGAVPHGFVQACPECGRKTRTAGRRQPP